MKLVWLVNTILPQIARSQGKRNDVIGGWTVQLADMIVDNPDVELTVFYPQHESGSAIRGNAGRINYVGFFESAIPRTEYDPDLTKRLKTEIELIQPHMIHIWGTEFVHTLSMVRAFGDREHTLISIQGLIGFLGKNYTADLPERIINRHTFRDLIRKDSIAEQKEKFLKRGRCESLAIIESGHIVGRTEWDHSRVMSINPGIEYHHAGEILRKEFYEKEKRWSAADSQKHRIFITQSYYPIKGIHFVLSALENVLRVYPDVRLIVSGKDMRPGSLKDRIKQDSYGKYVCELIREKNIGDHIEFSGELSASQMLREYLKCSVFILPSVMENSSNSLGEAMILGVPCIASKTGGTPDMIRPDEGWLYTYNDTDELSNAIIEAFRLTDIERNERRRELEDMLERARKHALECYNPKRNMNEYMQVYREIMMTK